MNIIEFLKKGSGIHIKKENKGKFTSYCGGKVTQECIQRGKHSSNPAIRKRATFADNARHFKHSSGGAFKKNVNVLDSNPRMYKYEKKRFPMKKHQYGGQFDSVVINDNKSAIVRGVENMRIQAQQAMEQKKQQEEFELQQKILKEQQQAQKVNGILSSLQNIAIPLAANLASNALNKNGLPASISTSTNFKTDFSPNLSYSTNQFQVNSVLNNPNYLLQNENNK